MSHFRRSRTHVASFYGLFSLPEGLLTLLPPRRYWE
jgi:hypothetical protein